MGSTGRRGLGAERRSAPSPKSGGGLVGSGWKRRQVEAARAWGVTLRRFNGWEPAQIHIHQDLDGNETGRTIVTVEPEWDDEQREIALAIQAYEKQLCPNCGGHIDHIFDDSIDRRVQHEKFVCLDCKAIADLRKARHVERNHNDKTCDCDEYTTWVDRYVPKRTE